MRLIDGEKVFLTQLLCIDSGGCTFKIGEILHSTRACYSCDLALQTVKHSLERLCTSGTMATIAPGRLWPAFFYTDKDMALLNSLCCFANRRNEVTRCSFAGCKGCQQEQRQCCELCTCSRVMRQGLTYENNALFICVRCTLLCVACWNTLTRCTAGWVKSLP